MTTSIPENSSKFIDNLGHFEENIFKFDSSTVFAD